jgi:RHS repeat-associated protein
VTDRKVQTTAYENDALNRPVLFTYADGSTIRYVYDAGDRLLQVVDSEGGTIAREYDGLDRVISESTPEGTVAYTYDADDRRTTMTVEGQPSVSYEYDAAHNPITITQSDRVVSIEYNAGGRRSRLTLPNGIIATYGYDGANQLTSLAYTAGTSNVGDLTYTYDLAGNRIAVGGSLARTGLPPALSSAQYDAANRLTLWNGQSLSYDLNGNLTSDGGVAYTWNARNQLTGSAGTSAMAFQYDGVGRRRGRFGNGAVRYLYDGSSVVQELSVSTVANLLTGGIDEVFERTDGNGARTPLTDALGSIVALADASTVVRTRYVYEPFGATSASGEASANRAQYTGRENDGNGLYYHRARYYDPRRQRFVSEDPIGFFGGDTNLYAYVGGMPTRSTDPFGLYNRDVHYDLTRGTAVQVGMCAADAESIAHADQGVDDNFSTSPMPPQNVGAREKYHFTSRERREQLRQDAFGSGSRTAMGIYMHALQDSFSHQKGRKDRNGEPYGPIRGHIMDGHSPDNPRNRPILWRRMMETTRLELWNFHQLYPICPAGDR